MAQFLVIFHLVQATKYQAPDPSQAEAVDKKWQAYLGGIAGQGRFISTQRLAQAGTIISPDGTLTDAVTGNKNLIVGTLTLEADSHDEAVELSKDCPLLAMGGSVEVRPVVPFDLSKN